MVALLLEASELHVAILESVFSSTKTSSAKALLLSCMSVVFGKLQLL